MNGEIDILKNEEDSDMGSWAHSSIQAALARLLGNDGRFNVLTELNLDVSQVDLTQFGIHRDEIKPDVCLYAKKKRVEPTRDLIRMLEYPLTAIEILSPEQNLSELSAKLNAYFALGVKSYWLVLPMNESVTVYSSPTQFELFGAKDSEVVDEAMDIRLPVKEIFDLYLD